MAISDALPPSAPFDPNLYPSQSWGDYNYSPPPTDDVFTNVFPGQSWGDYNYRPPVPDMSYGEYNFSPPQGTNTTGSQVNPPVSANVPRIPSPSPSQPPDVSNEALNAFLGGGVTQKPSLPTAPAKPDWYDPNDPHPEVAFARKHFPDFNSWGYQDYVENYMRFWDKNHPRYYFADGKLNLGDLNIRRPPSFGGGSPIGSGMNIGGQGRGISGGETLFGGGLPSPMVANAAPTPMANISPQVSVSSDLNNLEIPDELWQFIPEQLRYRFGNSLMSWLRGMGWGSRGNIGRYGERSYSRPAGQTGSIWFSPETFSAFSDPETVKWAKWLLGERGFSARTEIPTTATP
jgi:hypothetical protein